MKPEEQISHLLKQHWDEFGYNEQTTASFLSKIRRGLSDQAIGIDTIVRFDDNDYPKHNNEE